MGQRAVHRKECRHFEHSLFTPRAFQPIGTEGQKRLNDSRAVIIGAGALGTASAEMLVRAGVGSVTILDRDYIEWSNLQRQQLYTEQDVKDRLPKAVAAEKDSSK